MGALHSTKQTVFTPLCLLTGFTITCSLPFNPPAIAQIIPDNSLGSESSVVVPNQNINGLDSDRIDGGAIRGSNLFHSFQEFNIDNGRGAYFSNPEAISNILTRVTGNNLSNILGTLGVLGNANLFLINPNGIVFGPNARLDVGGSFFASTADGILFENGVEFAASNPDAPPLLTINIPIGLNFRENPGNIINQARSTELNSDGNTTFTGLAVPSQETIALIGGEIRFEGGVIASSGSRIELGGLSEPGIVELNPDGSLSFPTNIQRADVLLTDSSVAGVVGNPGGSVAINARNLDISGGSQVTNGVGNISNSFNSSVEENVETGILQAGDITINATESVILTGQGSIIANQLFSNTSGNAGNIDIQTNSLSIRDGAFISTSTFGNGDGGNLTVTAADIEVVGTSADGQSRSSLEAAVASEATGNAGTLTINTQNLLVQDRGEILAATFGNGNGGNLTITATDIELIDSFVSASVEQGGIGDGGNLTINTQNLSVRDGAQINAVTFSNGDAGNLTVTATDIEVVGTTANSQFSSGLFASVESEAKGNGGNLTINTQNLLVRDGGRILASTFGDGDAGNLTVTATDIEVVGTSADGQTFTALSASVGQEAIGNSGTLTIDTQNLSVRDGARVSASTFGEGNAGQLFIRATDLVEVTGDSSFITADVNSQATGDGGDLTIDTQRLLVQDGGRISTSTFGDGNAGNLTITATEIELLGRSNDGQFSSGLRATVGSEAIGNAGDLTINTQRLSVREGAQVSASIFGSGEGGNLSIIANEIELIGTSDESQSLSGLFAQTNPESRGNAGNLTVDTQRLVVRDGARVSASTFGEGNAGQLFIRATDLVEVTGDSSFITADVNSQATGDGGDLTIDTQRLLVQDEARISTDTFGEGNAGQLFIRATDFVEVTGDSSFITADVNSQATGDGGDLTIDTQRLLVQDGGRISTSTFGDGNAGNLTITATEIELLGRSTDSRFSSGLRATVASEAMGNAGTLTINTQNLSVREGAQVLASTFGNGNVGSLTITATDVELVGRSADGQFSSALAASVEQGATGNSGTLRIDTQNLSVREGAQILAATFGNGNAGNLTINATDVELVGRSADGQFSSALSASVEQGATGNGDTLIINTQNLSVRDGAQVTTVTFADGDGGNLIVTATDIEVVGTSADGQFRSGLFASVEPDATGNSNSLIIDTQRLSVRDGAFVSTSTFGDGDAGNLTVTATDVELIGTSADGQFPSTLGSEATSESTGRAGTLTVNADNLTIRDGATIDVRSQSTEAAGDLIINAPNILLDNQATLNGETTAGEGNIILNTSDLRLRNNSSITTNATGEATGGNITINTETLTALEDSDISANAEDAFGGRITINAAGIFGTAFRTQQSRFSDITATSELGPEFSGTVELNTELDPSSGLIDLTQTVVDPSDLIAQEFCRQRGGSEFVVTGKGGIAADPNDKADGNQIEVDLVEPVPSRPRNSSQRRSETEDNQPISSLDIIPARGWIRDENGDVILVGYDPTKTGVQRQPAQLPQCQPNLNEENGTRSPSVPSGETPIN